MKKHIERTLSIQIWRSGQFGCPKIDISMMPTTDHHQAPVRLRPGITVGGQEIPSGIGMTTTGKTINCQKCDDKQMGEKRECTKKNEDRSSIQENTATATGNRCDDFR